MDPFQEIFGVKSTPVSAPNGGPKKRQALPKWIYCVFSNKRLFALYTNILYAKSFIMNLHKSERTDYYVIRFKLNNQKLSENWQNVTPEIMRSIYLDEFFNHD